MIYSIDGNILRHGPTNLSRRENVIDAVSTGSPLLHADLNRLILKHEKLQNIDIRYSDISDGDFSECYIMQGQFQSVNGKGCNFSDCYLLECDFSDAYLRDATFTNCLIVGCNFTQSQMHNVRALNCHIKDTQFERASLDGADFGATQTIFSLNRLINRHPDLRDILTAQMENASYRPQITNTSFVGTNLIGTSFQYMRFEDADFRRSYLTGAKFIDGRLRNVDFRGTSLNFVQFDRAVIDQSWLSGAVISRCSLIKTTLSEMQISEISFEKCDLTSAIIQNINFVQPPDLTQRTDTLQNNQNGINEDFLLQFHDCKLKNSRFLNNQLINVRFVSNDLRKAIFKNNVLLGNLFEKCECKNIIFDTVHNFTQTIFKYCKLFGANYSKSAVEGLNFQKCDLKHSQFPTHASNSIRLTQCDIQSSSLALDLSFAPPQIPHQVPQTHLLPTQQVPSRAPTPALPSHTDTPSSEHTNTALNPIPEEENPNEDAE